MFKRARSDLVAIFRSFVLDGRFFPFAWNVLGNTVGVLSLFVNRVSRDKTLISLYRIGTGDGVLHRTIDKHYIYIGAVKFSADVILHAVPSFEGAASPAQEKGDILSRWWLSLT